MRGPLGSVIGRYPSSDGSSQVGGIIRQIGNAEMFRFLSFLALWVAMIVNSSFGFNQGNPQGNVCGDKHANPDLHELELMYWLNPNQVYLSGLKNSQFKLANARTICLLDCPIPSEDTLNWVCDYPAGDIRISFNDWIDSNYDYFEFLTPEMRNTSLQLQGPCYPVIFPSVNVFWRCQYIAHPSNVSLRHWQQMGGVHINEDIIDKSIHKSINARSSVLKELSHLRTVAVLMTVIMVVAILTSIAIVRRILMATSVLKVAAKVIGEVQALIIFPVIPYVVLAIFYMVWFSAAFHLFSSGRIVQNDCDSSCCAYDLESKKVSCDHCCGYSIHYTSHIAVAIIFHLFGCYWATQFFIACSATVIAGSVASYYWAHGGTSPEITFLPVFSSMRRLMRYSLGSVALGSLTVSFVESVRFMLESIRRKLKVTGTTPDGCIGKMAHHTSQFCLRCVEWTIKSVNRNAYIMIAITGKSFCRASAIATELIMNNILRIGKVNVIGDVILCLLGSRLYCCNSFLAVVEMSIDTIILSFCQDSDEHQGTAQYAPPLLIETLNDQNEMQRLTQ
ncbi:hypothetical protein GH714_025387 [Hevea brasiliensis]|uniref:Choline transporter-like protein n=1 Tax=Hevea brasiliensis TaxID=3981 RepID=A0A6A6MQ61_HEVBR|nr:hypothetical protein GH714_025387 [Hevea brasiliensis]